MLLNHKERKPQKHKPQLSLVNMSAQSAQSLLASSILHDLFRHEGILGVTGPGTSLITWEVTLHKMSNYTRPHKAKK